MRGSSPAHSAGFTLLEVVVAFALIVVVVFAAMMSQSQGLLASTQNRNLVLATSLARGLINEEELKREGMNFDTLEAKYSGAFDSNKDFKWTIEYSKVDFAPLIELIQRANAKEAQNDPAAAQNSQQLSTVMNIFKNYLEKSVRRMKVTIEWPDGKGTSNQTFTELLIDYDQEFSLTT